jgi:OOP family OmpA-OmpF porin
MFKLGVLGAVMAVASLAYAVERTTVPTADRKGAKDSPLLRRYDGSFIVPYEQKAFAEFILPLSTLVEVPGKKDHKKVRIYAPAQKKVLEGAYTRLVYVIPEHRSPLEVLRNYQEEIGSKGVKILFDFNKAEAKPDSDPTRSTAHPTHGSMRQKRRHATSVDTGSNRDYTLINRAAM